MTRVIPLVLLLVALGAAMVVSPAAAEGLVDLARPDVNILAGVRVANFAASPLVRMFWDRARAEQPQFDQLLSVMGPNPLEMIDEVILGASMDGSQAENPEGLVLASGRSMKPWWSARCAPRAARQISTKASKFGDRWAMTMTNTS